MTATATRIATTRNPMHALVELRSLVSILAIVAISIVLGIALSLSVLGAARSGLELPAPGMIPMAPPAADSDAQPVLQPETAPPGLDL